MSKLRIGIVGHGKMGHIRRETAAKIENLELAVLCDVNQDNALDGVPFETDWHKVFDHNIDLVFVCTTNDLIPEVAVAALNRGIHTFCEKPPGRTIDDVLRIRAAESRSGGAKLKFGFNHRYHQAVMDANALVKKGRLGRVLWMRGIYGKAGGPGYDRNWRNDPRRSGGGILIDQGIHILDLLLLFCGEFEEVKSFVGRNFWQVPVEDNAFAMLRNSAGQVAMVHSSATQWRHTFRLEIYMEQGYLVIEGILSSTGTYGQETLKVARCVLDDDGYPLPNPQETETYYSEDRSWELELAEFLDCVRNDKPVRVGSSADALAVMKLVHQIYDQDGPWKKRAQLVEGARIEK